ncbi:DASH family cryptochrome [Rhodoferax sp.]|uniref:DASH family cryptochrome n=1 Tax=Rhodoferax sp. TaxID=50421 RepID=UPI00262BABE3|nr:DASH family cryptochrome [Rhodoferax sp.]MDD2810204.1 DASH family cryptochrome [Rhodoferax sp.]
MTTLIYWFRNDLRLHDNPALTQACAQASAVLPVYCLGSASATHNGEPRWGVMQPSVHRQRVLLDSLQDLDAQLRRLGSALTVLYGAPGEMLPKLAQALNVRTVHCEHIAATHERSEVDGLQQAGLNVASHWQSSLFEPAALPFKVPDLPPVYTQFCQALNHAHTPVAAPLPAPAQLPPLPRTAHGYACVNLAQALAKLGDITPEPRSSVPYWLGDFAGGERAALGHLARYFASNLPPSYKATRNGLTGTDFSSKVSLWLASGALSVRRLHQSMVDFEHTHGANEGTEWLQKELLWRDYFRFLHLQHGDTLFRYRGLRDKVPPVHHDPAQFTRWCLGRTGEPLVDAAMHELLATGYLSNRLRQVAASYLIHELGGDWRAGAAWFEAQLFDYDVYNNQGNWLYIAGMGCDPRGGRRFNVAKQAQDHDPDQRYQKLWQQV